MRILELRWKNLNSLYGQWIIDFTAPEYAADGIFVLTGPTGAGKSTILDAICLALYGATPRLGKITKNSNEIMSRQTGECYAEVVFESHAKRFRCHWEQRRARKKPDGKLQEQEHQIADAETGKIIESKKSKVVDVIEEKTGMDFDRFTRSILLAQGGFDTFLKADAEQKSRILEQITGTEIYSEISRQVHERNRDEQEKLKILLAETAGITVLSPKEEEEIAQKLEENVRDETKITHESTEINKAIIWINTIENLQKELHALGEDAAKMRTTTEAFAPQRLALEWADKAASLDAVYAILAALRKQQAEDQKSLEKSTSALPELKARTANQSKILDTMEQGTLAKKEAQRATAPLRQEIRTLDQALAGQKKTVAEYSAACKRQTIKINTNKENLQEKQYKRADTQKTLESIDLYQKNNSHDEWLSSEIAGIKEQLKNLFIRQKENCEKRVAQKKADAVVAEARHKEQAAAKQHALCKEAAGTAEQQLQQAQQLLQQLLAGKLLREYRAEKESLLREQSYINSIASLTKQRTRLEDGKPCPLCGATEHPFALGNIPTPDDIEQKIKAIEQLINRAEKGEEVIRQREKASTATCEQLNASEKLVLTASSNTKAAEKTAREIGTELMRLEEKFAKEKQHIYQQLDRHGYRLDFASDPSDVISILQSKVEKWQKESRRKEEIKQRLNSMDNEIENLKAIIETEQQTADEQQEKLNQLQKEYAAQKERRRELYGDRDPDSEERQFNSAIDAAEKEEKKARAVHGQLLQELAAATTDNNLLKKRIQQRETELQKQEHTFSAALKTAGFTDEQTFLKARLPTSKREELSLQARELDQAQAELKATQKERQARLTAEAAKKITDKPLAELEQQCRKQADRLTELRNSLAELKHKLKENKAAQLRIKEQKTAVEKQKKEADRFAKLHKLIGSADGKKYRNFAQGLTFELMVNHANRQLAKMTDRYLLMRDNSQPLELNVVDNYQAGEIRSTKNLSGGESFIVSLTLALGLSQMASQRVRVDSLFLDEGFGTLDKDTLETALETLAGLQQDGKLIGIISHIPALQERIRTQIHISPGSIKKSYKL